MLIDLGNENIQMSIKIDTSFVWLLPPQNKEEEVFRKEADVKITAATKKLEAAFGRLLLKSIQDKEVSKDGNA